MPTIYDQGNIGNKCKDFIICKSVSMSKNDPKKTVFKNNSVDV